MQQKLKSYEEYLPIADKLINQVRQKQHDYTNQLQSIRALAYVTDDAALLKSKLLDSVDYYASHSNVNPVLKINMPLLAGFLISREAAAADEGILLHIEVKNYQIDSAVQEYLLIDYVGILIDNAVEATRNSFSEKDIYCRIDSENGKFSFLIQNPGPKIRPDFMKNIFKKGYTTKEGDGHGLGLYNLKKGIDDYQGTIHVYNEQIAGNEYICFDMRV